MQVAFRIHARLRDDTAKMVLRNRGIIGEVALRLGELWFPSQGWTDSVPLVLSSMAHSLFLLKDEVIEVNTRFMNGPYELYCRRRTTSRTLCLTCVYNDKPLYSKPFHIDRRHYAAELSRAADAVLQQCRDFGLSQFREAVSLRKALNQMKRQETQRIREGWIGW